MAQWVRSVASALFIGIVAVSCAQSPGAQSPGAQSPGAQSPGTPPAGALGSTTELFVYVGTYTRGDSEGIYVYRMDLSSGDFSDVELAAKSVNPSFLALAPDGGFLYAVNEIESFEGASSGAVSSFSIDRATGALTPINQVASKGGAPCHLIVNRRGTRLLLANYSGGSVAVVPISEDGRLGDPTDFVQHEGSSITSRQKGPHAHSIHLDPKNRFAVAADLGIDKIVSYRFDSSAGTLQRASFAPLRPGAGPRQLKFHPTERFAYVINELDSTITVFSYEAESGTLEEAQTILTLPSSFGGTSHTAEIQVHPSGRFVYGSNRGHDSIAAFRVDPNAGTLTVIEYEPSGGASPRHFGIDPTGRYLVAANQKSNNIVVFEIDPENGELENTGKEITIPSPVCVKFLPVR